MITKFGFKIGLIFWIVVAILLAVFGSGEGSHDPHAINPWEIAQKAFNIVLLLDILLFASKSTLKDFFKSRGEKIQQDIVSSEQTTKELEEQLNSLREKIRHIDDDIKAIIEKARKEAETEKEAIIEKAERDAEKIVEMTKNEIEVEYSQASKKLKAEIANLALQKSEEIIKSKLSKKDQDRILDEYIDGLRELK